MPRPRTPYVVRRRGSPSYVLVYWDADGNRIRESSGATGRREAEAKLEQRLETLVVAASKRLPIRDGFELFLCERPLKPSAKKRYEVSRDRWAEFLAQKNIDDFTQLTKSLIAEFVRCRRSQIVHLTKKRVSDPTVRRDIAFLSSVWHHLLDTPEWEDSMPPYPVTRNMKRNIRESPERVRSASDAEWKMIMAAAKKPMHRAALTVAVETGMREMELCQLTWDIVDLNRRQIRLTPHVVNTKNNKSRVIPLSQTACDTLRVTARHDESRFVFWHGQRGAPFNRFKWWKAVRRRSGVKNIRFHDIRHTFATNFLSDTGDLMSLSKILGHATVAVTQRYAHLLTQTLHDRMRVVDVRKARRVAAANAKVDPVSDTLVTQRQRTANGGRDHDKQDSND